MERQLVFLLSFIILNGLLFQADAAAPVFTWPATGGSTAVSVDEDTGIGTSIGLLSATDTDGDALTYSTTSSDFTVDVATLRTATTFDYESATKIYTVTVSVNDGTSTISETLTVNIADVNDNTPTFSPGAYYGTVQEGTGSGTSIATVTCSDADSGVNGDCTVSIQSGDDGSAKFSVSGSTIQTSSNAIDYEALSAANFIYSLVVIGVDNPATGTAKTGTTSVFVTVTGTNDNTPAITSTNPASESIAENSAVGTTVSTVVASDADLGSDGTITYSITAGNSLGHFGIVSTTGEILVVQSLDKETVASYALTVTASDGGSPVNTATSVVNVALTDVNDNDPSCTSYAIIQSLAETDASGTAVTTLGCTDDDSSDSVTYSIASGNAAGCFACTTAGVITTACTLDYDAGTRYYTLLVDATDGTNTVTVTVDVTVTAVNQHTPAFASNPTLSSIAENTAVGTTLTTYAATDDDASPHGITTYAITTVSNSGASKFSIDSTSGKILLAQTLDYESYTSYQITVTATDGTNTGTGTVTVPISDVNDNDPSCTAFTISRSVSETASSGSAVVTPACSDADTADTLAYSITNGNSAGCFAIVGASGAITTACTLDYDAGTRNYELLIDVTDSTNTVTVTVDIAITAENEATPAFSSNPTVSAVAENSNVGTTITTYAATDTDASPHGITTYAISSVNNGGASLFSIDSASGKILLAQELDYETQTSYEIVVTASDGTNTGTGTVTVSLSDVNDNDPSCSPQSEVVSVAESASSGAAVTTLACTDADTGDTVSYSITSGNAAGCFSSTAAGAISTSCTLDYDAGTRYYTLLVDATDGTNTVTVTVDVTVTAVNQHTPAFASNPTLSSIAENTAVGTTLTTYAATDADASPHGITTYAITTVTNSGASKFSIDSASGKILLAQTLDYESYTSYQITVTATDGTNTGTGTVTVPISDVNDNDPSCTAFTISSTVSETASSGSAVVTPACSDADTGDTLAYSITNGNSAGCFAIVSASGAITTACTLDYDAGTRNYELLIDVTDSANTVTVTVDIAITAENEATPAFSSNPTVSAVAENSNVGTTIITYAATDADASPHGITTYAISSVNNGGASLFSIDSASGKILLAQELDYETQTSYEIVVTASDGTNTGTGTVTVPLSDVNDNAPACTSTSIVRTVLETATSGTAVVTPACSDADTGDTLTYSITNGNSAGCFACASATGAITTACTLDYDAGTRSYALQIEVTDSSSTATVTLNVDVTAVNEATPTFASNPTYSIAEDSVVGLSIGTYTAADADSSPYNIIQYAIQSVTNGGTAYFSIEQSSGKIQLAQTVDYEAYTSYLLTVTAYDGTNTGTGTVTVSVTDVNDNTPSCSPEAHILSVSENTATTTEVISNMACTDGDTGNTLSYTMTQNPGNKFAVAAGKLTVNAALDYETTTFYQLKVTVADDGAPSLSTTVDIDVSITNVDESAPVFTSSGSYAVSLSEDTSVGSTVATVVATDANDGDTIEYAFVSSYTGFLLDTSAGTVLLTQSLDRETASSHTLLVTATDGTTTVTATITLTVNDVNEVPVFGTTTYTPSFNENQAASTSCVQVAATDQDSGADGTITYSITAGDGSSYFTIVSSTGIISSSAVIDYEVNSFFYLVVQAADGGSPSLSATCLVQITIGDENDNAPTFAPQIYTESLAENSAIGTTVTTVTATDADSSTSNNNVFTYSTTSSVPFTVGTSSGEITTNAALDRETTSSYTMVILATDQGAPAQTGTSTITVTLTDLNDNDPVVSGTYDTTIAEDTAVNTVVFTITASDADINDNGRLTFSFNSGNTNTDFKIESATGIIQTVNSLDRETTSSYSLEVYVVDNGATARTTSVTCTVTISDLNDNTPVWSNAAYTFSVDENVATSSAVGTIAATDADTGVNSALTFTNVGYWSGDANKFTVDASSGLISTSGSLDRETVDTYVIWFRVQDGGSPVLSSDQNITITINDLNDNTPAFGSTLYSGTTTENDAVGTSIVTVTATDADAGANAVITYSIDTSDAAGTAADTYLTIGSSTGQIDVKANIDRETTADFNFKVLAVDGGTSALTGTTTVTITVSDVNDNDPVLSPTFFNTEVPYSDTCSSTILTLTATDADINENAQLVYYLVTSDINFLYSLDSSTGALTSAGTLTTGVKYVLYAHARDSGTPERTTATSATLRVDTYTPGDVMIAFYMSISQATYVASESTFLSQLDTVYQASYSTAITRRWCISESSGSSIIVYIYVLQNDDTNTVANIATTKLFLTASTIYGFVATDSAGTPSSKITGASWTAFGITKVELYQQSMDEDDPWIETAVGITVTTLLCVLGAAAIATAIGFTVYKCRQMRRTKDEPKPKTRAEIEEPKDKPPPYKRETTPKTGKTAVTPSGEKARVNAFIRAPGSDPNEWMNEERTASKSSSNGPIKNNKDYIVQNRAFDVKAVDPESGGVYRYSTKTQEREWLKTPEGKQVVVDVESRA